MDSISKGKDCDDFKFISLFLFGKQVQINLKSNSPSYSKFGTELIGTLVGRVWGQPNIYNFSEETVVAITIKTTSGNFTINCNDIEKINQAYQALEDY